MSRLSAFALLMAVYAGGDIAPAIAQGYPVKPVRLVVSYPAGGGVDYTARLVAQHMGGALGQPVVVENRAGAGGTIAEEYVSKLEPDGYTLLYTVASDMAARKYLSRKPALDPLKDLTPIASAIGSVNIILVGAGQQAKSVRQLVEFSKRNPGKLTYGTAGVQTYYYLIGELLKQNGLDMLHVPYKGNAQVVTALVAGEIDIALVNFAPAMPMLKAGKARALAVTEPRRYPGEPDVPTVAEDLPAFRAPLSWFGFFGPPGLAQPVVSRLNTEVARALEVPEARAKIADLYLSIISLPPEQVRSFIAETADLYARLVKTANIKPFDE